MQRINLYQDQFRRRRDWLDSRHLALMLLAGIAVLAAISANQAWRANAAEARASALEADRQAARARLESLQAQLEPERDDERLRKLRAELSAKQSLLDYLESGPLGERDGFSPFLDGLARHVVDGVWLSRITLREGGARMRLDGHAVDPDRVPQLITALGAAAAYDGHAFRRLAIDRPAEADWRVDFVLASTPGDGGEAP